MAVIQLNFTVTGQAIIAEEPLLVVTGSENVYECHFSFTSEWTGFEKTAVFTSQNEAREVLIHNDICVMPWEVLEREDIRRVELKIGVYGVKDDMRMPTVYTKPILVRPGAETAEGGGDPTPTQWEQILSMLADGTVYLDPTLTQSNKAAQADIVGDKFKKAVQSSGLYLQHGSLSGYSDANDFPANRVIEIASSVVEADIANLPAYGELAYVLTMTYNESTSYSAQVYFGRYTTATRIKAFDGWTAWRIGANADDVVTLDTSVDGDHGTYSDTLANVSKVCVFVASLTNWSDLPAEVKGNATIINMHQSSSFDMQVCIGRAEDKYFGWRIIRRSDRAVQTDWKSPTADLLINGNLLYGNGTSLNRGGGTGTCEVIKITDCPNMNIVSGVKVTRDSGTTGFLGIRTDTAFHCVAGTTYEFSAWVRGTGTVRLLVSNLYLRDCECAEDGSWQRFTLRFTANEDADYHFYVYNITPDSYIDIAGRELFVYTPDPEVAALRHTKYWTPNWFQGSLSPSSGGMISATNRVRSEGFVNFSDSIDGQLTIVIPEGWGLVGRRYGAPYRSAYERAITVNGTWITGTFTLTVRPDKYYRFVIRKQDDSDITPDDGQESGVSFSYASLEARPQIKILGIGNSHTRDAVRYVRRILDEAGYDAKVGHYYWGSSTLKEQYDALTGARAFPENTPEHPHTYYYRTYDATGTHSYYDGTLVTALADEMWDVVVFQQKTYKNAQYSSFFSDEFSINDFIDEVKQRINNDNLRIGIMLPHTRTYDFAGDTIDGVLYTPDMLHDAIQTVVPQVALDMKQCDFMVNSGLAVKYARENENLDALGHDMARIDVDVKTGTCTFDKNHLEYGIPTFIASMTYALTICGDAVGDILWYPASPTFYEIGIYGEGDVRLYDGATYRKNVSTDAESWKAAHWDEYDLTQLAYLGIQCARKAVRTSKVEREELSNLKKTAYRSYIIDTKTGSPAVFSDGADDIPMAELKTDIGYVQPGDGSPSLTNIRPIYGHAAANIWATRTNMLLTPYRQDTWSNRGIDFTVQPDGSVSASGEVSGSDQPYIVLRTSILLQPGVLYTISHGCKHPYGFAVVYFYEIKDGAPVSGPIIPDGHDVDLNTPITNMYISCWRTTQRQQRTFRVNRPYSVEFQLRFIGVSSVSAESYSVDDAVFMPMIRADLPGDWNTEPTWEPAEGVSITVTFGETGMVCGGTLNVTTGELTLTHRYLAFDGSESWSLAAASTNPMFLLIIERSSNAVNSSGVCSHFAAAGVTSANTVTGQRVYVYENSVRMNIRFDEQPATVDDFKALLADCAAEGKPVQIVYTLATPLMIRLRPAEVRTLLGENRIISDTGDVSVTYRADPTIRLSDLEARIAALENA